MTAAANLHPDALLESLLAKGARAQKQRNLKAVHEICRSVHDAGPRDFSISAIGKLCEAEGLLRGRALYNAQSADYRELIEAWAVYAGPSPPKPHKMLASHEFLLRISDPAIRSLMQAIVAERDKLKSQLNTLKANTTVVVDRRPPGTQGVSTSNSTPLSLLPDLQLTDSERESLRRAVSPNFLNDRGWREIEVGEIVNEQGRTIFDPGFATAIRKILETK